MDLQKDFHSVTIEEALSSTESHREGLDAREAQTRRTLYGANLLDEGRKRPLIMKIVDQIKNPMILVLIAAAIISGAFGEWVDMLIIFAVVALNTVMGIVQEGKADAAIEALKSMSAPHAKVLRNGEVSIEPVENLVPGDIVEIEAGDSIPADLRLIESASLKVEEAALTGESLPAEKDASALLSNDAPLGDRVNMAYSGTSAVYGRGKGVVVSTGMNTQVGRIAGSLLTAADKETPIQKKLAELSKILTILVLGVCVVIMGATVLRDWQSGTLSLPRVVDAFLLAVSLAVAAIPEGLPAVMTIVMAMGVQRMADRGAIIRKLPAVETLGCTDIICSDKTGTLTQNRMTVVELATAEGLFDDLTAGSASEDSVAKWVVEAMAFCNDTHRSEDTLVGDPTETALVAYADKVGYPLEHRLSASPRVGEFPFDSERKLMSTFHSTGGKFIQYTKGAPDMLLDRCDSVMTAAGIVPIDDETRASLRGINDRMASQALRVLACAMAVRDELPSDMAQGESGLTFLGMVGMIDPARPEVKDAVAVCRAAGIRPIMITGDHRTTAVAIARDLGILDDEHLAITGAELDAMSDEEFAESVDRYSVYARVSPENKVRIVEAWKARGKVAAMTGDGVHDAPALRRADIGVGMGITGADVTKNVADMLLTDDNFATIVVAVEEGRKIYSNMRKCVQFLLGSNLSEVLSVLVATLCGFPLLHTVQILWINLISDTLPALALGVEKAEPDSMKVPPRSSDEGVFSGGVGFSVAYQGIYLAAMTLIAYFIGKAVSPDVANSMAFCTLTFSQMLHALNVRSLSGSLLGLGLFTNKLMLLAVFGSIVLTVGITMIPGLNVIFHLKALALWEWAIVAGLSVSVIPFVELLKIVKRRLGIGKRA